MSDGERGKGDSEYFFYLAQGCIFSRYVMTQESGAKFGSVYVCGREGERESEREREHS